MGVETNIILIVEIVFLLIIVVLALIYILTIIFIRRFHTVTNILTGNVCIAAILCSSYWISYYIILAFYPMIFITSPIVCSLVPYFQTMFNCLIIYALAMITINRYFTVIYPQKRLFKRQTWSFISSAIQWVVIIILPLPNFAHFSQACLNYSIIPFWFRFYNLFIIVILPSIINVFFNTGIFWSVHSSTRRIQALASAVNANHQNTRDIYLLKHMLFIFIVFLGGWTPIYILTLIVPAETKLYFPYLVLEFLPELSSFIVVMNLFLYNHDLRNYIKERLLHYLHCN